MTDNHYFYAWMESIPKFIHAITGEQYSQDAGFIQTVRDRISPYYLSEFFISPNYFEFISDDVWTGRRVIKSVMDDFGNLVRVS